VVTKAKDEASNVAESSADGMQSSPGTPTAKPDSRHAQLLLLTTGHLAGVQANPTAELL
jgi:hypothetical protein